MTELRVLIPGMYADDEGRIYVNMREFLTHHLLPDSAEMRNAIWEELYDIFDGVELFELQE